MGRMTPDGRCRCATVDGNITQCDWCHFLNGMPRESAETVRGVVRASWADNAALREALGPLEWARDTYDEEADCHHPGGTCPLCGAEEAAESGHESDCPMRALATSPGGDLLARHRAEVEALRGLLRQVEERLATRLEINGYLQADLKQAAEQTDVLKGLLREDLKRHDHDTVTIEVADWLTRARAALGEVPAEPEDKRPQVWRGGRWEHVEWEELAGHLGFAAIGEATDA